MSIVPPGWCCTSCSGGNPGGTRFCGHCGVPRGAPAPSADAELASALARVPDTVSARRAETLGEAGERRLVTSLFADISGFTTLADTLDDPEELHEVIAPVIAGMAAIAERYEGFIAKYAGDALLVFFGAPVAHEDDPARALHVALEMHEALPELVTPLGPAAAGLELHIGINTGRVISGRYGGEERSDYSILGDAVIIAQRLESIAPEGQTYVGEATVQLAGDGFEFEHLGELAVKGKPRPVPTWRVLGRASSPAVAPATASFVGRADELARVIDTLSTAGGAVLVHGEPGVGKSSLLAEARRVLEGRGARWLQTRTVSYGAGLPFFPLANLVRQVLGVSVEEAPHDVAASLRAHAKVDAALAPHLAQLLGAEWPEAESVSPAAFRAGLPGALLDFLSQYATGAPAVLAVEDLHWADTGTLEVLRQLLDGTEVAHLSLLLTSRPEWIDAGDPLAVDGRVEPVPLAPFGAEDVAALVETVLGGPAPLHLVETVAARTDGNPLFATELVRSLVDAGDVERRHGHWVMRSGWSDTALPTTVERVLGARIDQLPPATASVLQTASVIGRLVRLPILEAVVDRTDIGSRLEELVAGGFLNPTRDGTDEALEFHHALLQDAAYERLMRRDRTELHARVAAAAEDIYGSGDDVIELLARHLFLAEAPADVTVPRLLQAAARSRNLYAHDAAIAHLGRALKLASGTSETSETVTRVRLQLAELHDIVGDYEEALDGYRSLRQRTGAHAAWCGEAAVLRRLGRYDEAVQVLEAAMAELDPQGMEAAALCLELGATLSTATRFTEARDALSAGLDASGPVDHGTVGRLLAQLGEVERVLGVLDRALEHVTAAQTMFERLGDLLGLTWAVRTVGAVHYSLGQLDEAVAAWRRAVELAHRTGAVEEMAGGLLNVGLVEMERGHLPEAIDCDRRALVEFERLGHGSGRAVAYGNLAEKLLLAGELQEAWDLAERALVHALEIDHVETVADVHHTMARLEQRAGRHDRAARLAVQAAREFDGAGISDRAARARALAAETGSAGGVAETAARRRRSVDTTVAPAGRVR